MEEAASQPSTSSSLSSKDLGKSKFDRLVKKMGRKLMAKPCNHIFVPSAISSGSSRMSYSPSGDDSQCSPHDELDRRKISAPASVGACLPPLSISVFGNEVAGSDYGWLTAADAPEPYHAVASVLRAQEVGLNLVKERIQWTKQQIDTCRKDQQMIADFVADAFVDELNANRNRSNYNQLVEEVQRLEKEVDELRKLSPRSVPPPRPAPPLQHLTWHCARCLEGNSTSSYRCHCSFPRIAIDPREAARCNCIHCSQTAANRVFASPTPGDGDWLLVNKLNVNGTGAP